MYQEGEIAICECERCRETFPVFTFVADTDMVTSGCVALTAAGNRLLLTETLPNESISGVEERVGGGFRLVLVRYVKAPIQAGLSFQEFRLVYKAPDPIYSCIACGGDSTVTKKRDQR